MAAERMILPWMQKYQIKNEKGDLIEFANHRFLLDIYEDQSQFLCVMKAAQVGMSTLEIVKNIYDAQRYGLDIIYTLPTDKDVQQFVGGKVNRIIQQNDILRSYTTDKDTIEQKRIKDSMVYFRGTWTNRAAIMITADRLVHDEIDSSKQDVVKEYQSRLQHSKHKQIHVFSHPSVPNVGIDISWKKSDQKHWFIRCPHCKREHFMEWPRSIDIQRRLFICKYCQAELSDSDRSNGRWVAKYKNAMFSGYWISLLITPWTKASEIIDKYNDPKVTEEFFYNKVLGLPYAGSGNVVTQDVIFRNLRPLQENLQDGRIVIGVDTGINLHYVIGNAKGLFYNATCPGEEGYRTLKDYLRRWKNAIIMIDGAGELLMTRQLQDEFPGRVFLVFYNKDRKNSEIAKWGTDKESHKVVADRNRGIQKVINNFADKRLSLYGTENDWYDYWLHFSHLYKLRKTNVIGVEEEVWEHTDRDDWVHATLYYLIGIMKYGGEGFFAGVPKRPLDVQYGINVNPNSTMDVIYKPVIPEGTSWEL